MRSLQDIVIKTFLAITVALPGVNQQNGTINGVPVVMPGSWGNQLGVIDLTIAKEKGKWRGETNQNASLRAIYDKNSKTSLVEADPEILQAVKVDHEATVDYVRQPVGTTTADIHSYFALVQDDPSIQIVTNAQKWYIEKQLKGTPDENLPVLSAGAPFKAGGRNGKAIIRLFQRGRSPLKMYRIFTCTQIQSQL